MKVRGVRIDIPLNKLSLLDFFSRVCFSKVKRPVSENFRLPTSNHKLTIYPLQATLSPSSPPPTYNRSNDLFKYQINETSRNAYSYCYG